MATLKQEIISTLSGFGNYHKLVKGEYYHSSGFQKSEHGIVSAGYFAHLMDGYTLTDLGTTTSYAMAYARGFAIYTQSPSNYLFCSGQQGEIIQSQSGSLSGSSAEYVHRSMQNHAYFNHIITDPKGRLLYHQDRYLGMFDGTGNTTNYVTGTVQVTNGSGAVVGTGTTFDASMVGKLFRISGDSKFYTITAFTDATHITIGSYTGTSGSGKTYMINTRWNDTWKDFGAVVTLPNNQTPKCPMDIYEDTVIFGRGNVLTTLNVVTDTITTDALPAMNLPAGYSIDHIVSNSNGILIGGNVRSKGFVFLWDNLSDRSIAPWIWFDDSVLSVCKEGSNWLVTTTRGLYRTNGYSAVLLTDSLLEMPFATMIDNKPKNTIVIGNDYYFFGQGGRARLRSVLYKMDIATKLVEAMPRYTLNQNSPTLSCFEYVAEANRLFMAVNGCGNENGVDYMVTTNAPKNAFFIVEGGKASANQKIAKKIKLRIRQNTPRYNNLSNTFSFDVAVKIADMKHTLYGFSQTKITEADAGHITVNGSLSFNQPKTGYEVEFVGDSGNDTNAGYARNVRSITGSGTSTERWTLDENFPSIPQISQNITVTPFQLVKRKTVTVTDGEIEELIFEVKDSIKASRYLIKIEIEDNTSNVMLEVDPPVFIYEDLGVL